MTTAPAALVTIGARVRHLAEQRPDETALIAVAEDATTRELSWEGLERAGNRFARRLAAEGVDEDAFVAIALPSGLEHLVTAVAAWKLGACAMPLSHRLPERERDRLLGLSKPRAVVSDWDGVDAIRSSEVLGADGDDRPLAHDPVPAPFKALASGGSTGQPKLIVSPAPFAHPGGEHPAPLLLDIRDRDVLLSPGPLYHNQPFLFSAMALYVGATAAVMERFRPELTLESIARLGVTYLNVVPTMMSRMLRADLDRFDLSSVRVLLHMAAPCPDWVKRAWIERLGPERVLELWGATEAVGNTIIRGDDWLERPGSVGRPVGCELKIVDDDGTELGPGEVGEIYSRPLLEDTTPYRYLGARPLPEIGDGFVSVGDLGWLDEDGYVYLADRRSDLIISGGANIFPAEVEQAVSAYPGVADVAVVGLDDDDRGQRVHAIVQPVDPADPPSEAEITAFCRERLAGYKCPRSIEIVDRLPRTETGKLRRGSLRDERR